MWQTGGPPVLHRITIVKLLTQHVVKRRLLGTHYGPSALLVVRLPVTKDWFEMGCHLSPRLISIRLTACRTSIPRKRRGNHKQQQTNKKVSICNIRSYLPPVVASLEIAVCKWGQIFQILNSYCISQNYREKSNKALPKNLLNN